MRKAIRIVSGVLFLIVLFPVTLGAMIWFFIREQAEAQPDPCRFFPEAGLGDCIGCGTFRKKYNLDR